MGARCGEGAEPGKGASPRRVAPFSLKKQPPPHPSSLHLLRKKEIFFNSLAFFFSVTLEFSQSSQAFNCFLPRLMANSIFHMGKNLYYSEISFFQTQGPRVIRGKDKVIL